MLHEVQRDSSSGGGGAPEIHGRFPRSCAPFINHSSIIQIN